MVRRRLPFARASRILFVLALFTTLVSTAAAFNNGQAASLVLGQTTFTNNTNATTASGMSFPTGVAIDPTSSKVFVADYGNTRVLRFASFAALTSGAAAEVVLGQPNFTSANPATSASEMNSPRGVAVDSVGRLWVADYGNSRVLRFDNASTKITGAAADGVLGQALFSTSGQATTVSGMSNPYAVAVDSAGHLWVADTLNQRVLRFDNAASKADGAAANGVLGQTLFTTNASALSATGMINPAGVAVDSAGNLWVGDQSNNRVLRFNNAAAKANGAAADGVLGQPNFTSGGGNATQNGLGFPRSLAVDSAGNLWVSDRNNNRVLRFDNAAAKANGANADSVLGQPDFTNTNAALTASGLDVPEGVTVDSAGHLWVADSSNRRVLRFDKPAPTITWANPAAISYGTALSLTQLNAIANVPGIFSYTPALGSALNVGNGQMLSVLFTPNDGANYSTATATVTIDVTPATQTITFGGLADKAVDNAPFSVNATASSGLPVTFSSTGGCTISGSTVTIVSLGICTIKADQAGNANYAAAPQVAQSFTVVPAGTLQLKLYLSLVRR